MIKEFIKRLKEIDSIVDRYSVRQGRFTIIKGYRLDRILFLIVTLVFIVFVIGSVNDYFVADKHFYAVCDKEFPMICNNPFYNSCDGELVSVCQEEYFTGFIGEKPGFFFSHLSEVTIALFAFYFLINSLLYNRKLISEGIRK